MICSLDSGAHLCLIQQAWALDARGDCFVIQIRIVPEHYVFPDRINAICWLLPAQVWLAGAVVDGVLGAVDACIQSSAFQDLVHVSFARTLHKLGLGISFGLRLPILQLFLIWLFNLWLEYFATQQFFNGSSAVGRLIFRCQHLQRELGRQHLKQTLY